MIITEKRIREIVLEEIIREQEEANQDCPIPFLAAILASEAPNSEREMSAVYDVIIKRAAIGFKEVNTVDKQLRVPKQFSGYTRFRPDDATFIAYYSGTAPDSEYSVSADRVETEKLIRRNQFKRACGVIVSDFQDPGNPDAPTYGATHFVNPRAASTDLKWWELDTFRPIPINNGYIGDHLFGWDLTTSQSRESYLQFRSSHPEFSSLYPD